MNTLRSRAGTTVVETLAALVVLSVSTTGLMAMLAADTHNERDREARLAAERIARNEVERIRIAGAWYGPTAATWTVDESGAPARAGAHGVTVARDARCDGGAWYRDAGSESLPLASCPGARAAARYTVTVTYSQGAGSGATTHVVWLADDPAASRAWNPAGGS